MKTIILQISTKGKNVIHAWHEKLLKQGCQFSVLSSEVYDQTHNISVGFFQCLIFYQLYCNSKIQLCFQHLYLYTTWPSYSHTKRTPIEMKLLFHSPETTVKMQSRKYLKCNTFLTHQQNLHKLHKCYISQYLIYPFVTTTQL